MLLLPQLSGNHIRFIDAKAMEGCQGHQLLHSQRLTQAHGHLGLGTGMGQKSIKLVE